MTRTFTCRGFEGHCFRSLMSGWWIAVVTIGNVRFEGAADTPSAAKSRVRRKLDAVERAFRERGWR